MSVASQLPLGLDGTGPATCDLQVSHLQISTGADDDSQVFACLWKCSERTNRQS